jgi:hypothetical protein
MAKAPTRTKDEDEDDTEVMTKAIRTRTKDEDDEAEEKDAVEPLAVSDVAPGFTAGPIPGAGSISAIKTDTATYGTETPPRQTPPTSIENFMKHSPPSFHDSNGVKIASTLPTLSTISPTTAVASTGADFTMTFTGTNFDRATFATWNGALQSQSQYVSATSLTCVIKPSLQPPGAATSSFNVVNNGGVSTTPKTFTWT